MTKHEMYSFIELKSELLIALVGSHDLSVVQMLSVLKESLMTHEWPEGSYLSVDREIDEIIRHQSSSVAERVYSSLRKQFGFARLSEDPKHQIAKIIKRGKIKCEEEAMIVRDALSGDYGELTRERITALGKIMSTFESARDK
jgi:hypothetical protein